MKLVEGNNLLNVLMSSGIPGEPSGYISDKWVNKVPEGYKLPMPLQCEADEETFEVGVSYVSTSSEAFVVGARVAVTRPDGFVVTPNIDWAGISPGETLSVEYNISKVDQAGSWAITLTLVTEDNVVLDSFSGVVLNVGGIEASIAEIWVNKGSYSHQSLPFRCEPDGQTFEVGVSYRNNNSSLSYIIGAEVTVTKPDGSVVTPVVDWAGISPGELLSKEYNIASVDIAGTWTITIRLLRQAGMVVLDSFSGTVLNVVSEVPEFRNFRVDTVTSPVSTGDRCLVLVMFDYMGEAITRTVYAAIGNDGLFGFDEILAGQHEIAISSSTTGWMTQGVVVGIDITSAISPAGSPYDVYAKIDGVIESPVVVDAVVITQ